MAKDLVPALTPDQPVRVPENGDNVNAELVLGQQGEIDPAVVALFNKTWCLYQGEVNLRGVRVTAILADVGRRPVAPPLDGTVQADRAELLLLFVGDILGVMRGDGAKLAFTGVSGGALGGNPPKTTGLVNELRALNTPKAWALFRTADGVGLVVNHVDGVNVLVGTVEPTNKNLFHVILTAPMTTADFAIQVFARRMDTSIVVQPTHMARPAANQIDLTFNVGALDLNNIEISIYVFGRQNS